MYSAILQAFIDIQNLSELLAFSPDVTDIPNAPELRISSDDTSSSIEFKNVTFHYPGQDEERGLKNLSCIIPAGSSTAIVGHTGAGKNFSFIHYLGCFLLLFASFQEKLQ